jgi:hypothetical protein
MQNCYMIQVRQVVLWLESCAQLGTAFWRSLKVRPDLQLHLQGYEDTRFPVLYDNTLFFKLVIGLW